MQNHVRGMTATREGTQHRIDMNWWVNMPTTAVRAVH